MRGPFHPCDMFFKCVISTFIFLTTFTYAQKLSAQNTDQQVTPADRRTEGAPITTSLPEPGKTAVSTAPDDSCIIPENTDVIHFPLENWDSLSEFFKTAEETIDTVKEGFNNFVQFFETQLDLTPDSADNKKQSTESTVSAVLEKAAYLQFTLARLIQKNPNSLVFHEFTTQIHDTRYLNKLAPWTTNTISQPDQLPDLENRKPEHLYYLVREQFPHGLPIQYKYLDEDQKYTLAITGGVHTLFFMDQLPVIFPSISNADYQMLNINEGESAYCDSYYRGLFKICVSSYYMLQVFRAEKLASIVNNLLNISSPFQQEKPIAILAYRDTHDLSPYFPNKKFYKLPSACIQPEEK